MKVLIADDSIISRHLLNATLRKWDYDVVVTSDGIEASSAILSQPDIRLAILDWVMPGLTGPEVCRKIRQTLGPSRYVYTILLTSKSLKEDLIEGMESGADDYITKPFDQDELKVRLRAGTRILDALGYSEGPLSPIQFYSCFISYSSEDQEFASRLHGDLLSHGISCWYAPEDLKIGDKFRSTIDESIVVHDKLLLILSKSSIGSRWVATEVEAALDEEQRRIKTVPENLRGNVTLLFPIRLDDTPLSSSEGWVGEVRRTRHIGDFRYWSDPVRYDKALQRLLRDLAVSDELDRESVKTRKRIAEKLD